MIRENNSTATPTTINGILHTNKGGATWSPCAQGHSWITAISIGADLEGMPCACGEVLFHSEKCECCGQPVVKPIPNPHKK